MMVFTQKKKIKNAAYVLFTKIVEQARTAKFYSEWGVEDTLDGRFDLITLHLSMVINRLEQKENDKKMALMTRYIQEILFDNMDMSLRELGVGDMSVGKKVKIMAEAFYGRNGAYQKEFESDDTGEKLKAALIRNIFRGKSPEAAILDHLVLYINNQIKSLRAFTDDDVMSAKIFFSEVK